MADLAEIAVAAPVYRGDFWSDAVILDPYPVYRQLRALGPVVWMERHRAFALTHHASVSRALLNPSVYSSAHGVMMNEPMNQASRGTMLNTDDPDHLAMRRLFARPLLPKALAALRDRLAALADDHVAALVGKRRFDAVAELAHFLPMAIVVELVGLDAEGQANMLAWAAAIFDGFGPAGHPRTEQGLAVTQAVVGYVMERLDRANLAPGGWGEALFAAHDRGEISEATARMMLIDYLTPALDTTINATSAAIELFARHPDQWERLRGEPALIPHAINEVIRLESPIRAFSRFTLRDHVEGGIEIPAGSRVLMLYACANRDDGHYPDADRFDIGRKPSDHLGFGMGTHICAGMHLARLEITVLLEALIRRVASFEVQAAERRPHNTLRGLHRLDVTIEPALQGRNGE